MDIRHMEEIVKKELWDHYSEIPNPSWYEYKNKKNMENMENMKNLEQELKQFEEDIFAGKDIDITEFYMLKKTLLDITLSGHVVEEYRGALEVHQVLENMLDRRHNELMNKRLNLLTIWSTIFLPLSFYTGLWGMNFDDVPLITDDNGFWVFMGLTIITIGGMWIYFKKNKWI